MSEYIGAAVVLVLAGIGFVSGYAKLAERVKQVQRELGEHIVASEARFNEHMAADDARHKDHVLMAVYDLQIKHLTEKLEEICDDLKELKRLIVLPVSGRH